MIRQSNNRARNRTSGGKRHHRVSFSVMQVLLAFWVAVGMHVIHPLLHRAQRCAQVDSSVATAKSVRAFSRGCSHRHANKHDDVRTDSQALTAGVAITLSPGGASAHACKGACPVCVFLAQTGKWIYSAPAFVLTYARPKEQVPYYEHDVFCSLPLLNVQARSPPPHFSFTS